MKKIYSLFIAAMAIATVSAQCTDLFFSEYVEGSGNNKALEIYNPTATAVNLSTYKVLLYVNGSTSPSSLSLTGTLAAGDVFVLCNGGSIASIKAFADNASANSVANFTGNDVLALLNGADTLDRIGVIGVSTNFKFDTTNAENFTYVRKPTVQQGTKNWAVGTLQWIQFPRDTIRLGAHTMDACGAITDTIARFLPTALTVSESAGTAVVNVVLNAVSLSSSFTVNVEYTGGTGTIDDISNYTTQTLTFAPNSSSQAFTVNINDDANNEPAETFIFKLRNAAGGILIGADSTYTLTISASDAPITIVDIAEITGLDTAFAADSVGKKVFVTGTVYGINNRSMGSQFYIHDATDGIQVFSPISNFGYPVLEGDSVAISGEVGFFAGLTQLVFLDTLYKIGTGVVPTPFVVQDLDESTECELVRLNNVSLVTPSQWDTTGKSSGFSCTVTDGQNTWEIRIDEQTNIYKTNMAKPTGKFDVLGIGGQFDNTSPYNSGYQIQPRYMQDIILINGINDVEVANVQVFPNPNNGQFKINWLENSNGFTATLFNLNGQVVTSIQSNENATTVSAEGIATGLYILEVKGGNKTFRSKLTISK